MGIVICISHLIRWTEKRERDYVSALGQEFVCLAFEPIIVACQRLNQFISVMAPMIASRGYFFGFFNVVDLIFTRPKEAEVVKGQSCLPWSHVHVLFINPCVFFTSKHSFLLSGFQLLIASIDSLTCLVGFPFNDLTNKFIYPQENKINN